MKLATVALITGALIRTLIQGTQWWQLKIDLDLQIRDDHSCVCLFSIELKGWPKMKRGLKRLPQLTFTKKLLPCVCVFEKAKKNALQTDKNVNVKCVWLCICVDLRWWERKEREKICRHATKVDWGSQRSQAAAVTDTQKMRQSDSCSQFTGSAIASHSSDFYCHPSSLGSARQEH